MNNPYPHEHSIRIEQPSKERFSRFRRVNNQFGKGISAIWGVLKRKVGNRTTELQALRFDAKKFTPAMVRKWIDSHGGRKLNLVIETATDYGKVGEVYQGNPMSKLDVAAWLEAAYHEEKKGIVEYEKLLGYIGNAPEYEGVKRLLKRIIKDEKRHVNAIENILRF